MKTIILSVLLFSVSLGLMAYTHTTFYKDVLMYQYTGTKEFNHIRLNVRALPWDQSSAGDTLYLVYRFPGATWTTDPETGACILESCEVKHCTWNFFGVTESDKPFFKGFDFNPSSQSIIPICTKKDAERDALQWVYACPDNVPLNKYSLTTYFTVVIGPKDATTADIYRIMSDEGRPICQSESSAEE